MRGAAALVVALLALAAPASAAERQTASLTFTTAKPGAPTGLRLAIDFRDPANPDGKPYAVQAFRITLPAGTKLDFTVAEQCKASDAELMLQGTAACPKGSRIGGGTIVTDTGSPGVLPRYGMNKVTQFNNDHELITVAETTDPPTRVVGRSKVEGRSYDNQVPLLPGGPPPEPYTAFKSMRLAGPALVRSGRTGMRTPATCPKSGAWTSKIVFTYRDGVTQTASPRSRCSRAR